jgi:hypothetical protein
MAPMPGHVLIQGGSPGHAVLLVDAAGERLYLPAQSTMPARDIHRLKNRERPRSLVPGPFQGTSGRAGEDLRSDALRRFPDGRPVLQ